MGQYTMGSLFAGIGGFDLGFERAGFKTSWQVEIDPYCLKVLAKNFPEAERFGDIRGVGKHNLKPVDVICGGFPCQDISNAGLRAGITGERSGLWSEYARIIRELRPAYVVVENVAALLGRGMGVVLGDLASIGYDAEWEVISAADVGAPHLRERVWVLAYGEGDTSCPDPNRFGSYRAEIHIERSTELRNKQICESGSLGKSMADSARLQQRWQEQRAERERVGTSREPFFATADADSEGLEIARHAGGISQTPCGVESRATSDGNSWWIIEPNVGRVAHGVPKRVDRLRGLGNAVVPQIPQLLAERIKLALEATE